MMDKINVAIIDRQTLFRVGVKQTLSNEPDLEIVESDLGEPAMDLIESFLPNVVLLDIDYPSLSGIEMASQISRYFPGAKTIVLSPYIDDNQLFESVKVGAAAYLSKDILASELAEMIRQVHHGKYPINDSILEKAQVAEKLLRQFQELTKTQAMRRIVAPLTQRETEILKNIAEGQTNRQIGELLCISEQTIKNHVTSILRKLNANDRAHAVVLAMRRGLIPLAEDENMTNGSSK